MTPPQEILDLVEHFERNEADFRSNRYNETELRREFLDPFFEALGWDVNNRHRYSETYKDVFHEPTRETDEGTPDYCFRVGGTPKFYLEAKKPSVRLKDNPEPALQLRRYGWSSKLPLSVLSSFDELAIYDCRIAPKQGDKASTARISYYTYRDYPEKWEEIASRFSKEAVLQGSFDRFVVSSKAKKGTAEVDKAFLVEIESWRRDLAATIAVRNPMLTQREVNFSVQRTIDRIIFLRICEDRGLEGYGQLRKLTEHTSIYPRLCELFRKADERYNSGLFHFQEEKNRDEDPDTVTPTLKVDDARLKPILKRLYYPESPYAFSHVPADILGQVYEQFLGQIIRITPARQVKIEPKPEVKKAGGVYYTPTYIVDYIVKSTVGQLLDGKSPKQVSKIRVLDPACGSGSFLIGAYQYLLNWYRDAYVIEGPQKYKNEIVRDQVGNWRLTLDEKKKILIRHIFGVDIDSQAVEVTKLSLLLKVLEGESQLKLFHERALPDLGKNIKCGNSLVGPAFYEKQQLSLLDDEDRYRINVFDWKQGFPQILKDGGFDAVIGNPPYSYRNATESELRSYYLAQYGSAEGNFELYKFFVEHNIEICRANGLVGMIISSTFLVQPTFEKLRGILLGCEIIMLAPLGPNVFANATVDTTIFVAKKSTVVDMHEVRIVAPESPLELARTESYSVRQARFALNPGLVFDYKLSESAAIVAKRLFDNFPNIEKGYEFGVGINTGYIRDELVADERIDSRYHRMVPGSGISRYGQAETVGWIMYDVDYVKSRGSRGRTLPAEYLLNSEKILVVRTRNLSLKRRIIATIDDTGAYNLNRLSNIVARDGYDLKGLLGILNSKLFQWLFSTRFFDYEIKPVYLRSAPLADSNNPKLILLVTDMLSMCEKLEAAKTDHERTVFERRIESLDQQIDKLVYGLYGLTNLEVRAIESTMGDLV